MNRIKRIFGGSRAFYVIWFITLTFNTTSLLIASVNLPQKDSTQSLKSSQIVVQQDKMQIEEISEAKQEDQENHHNIEYRTPEELQIKRLFNLMTELGSISSEAQRRQFCNAVYTYGIQYSIDPLLLFAIARVESNFNKTIIGPGNCVGYFQVNLRVHKVSSNFRYNTQQQTKKACQIYVYFRNIHKGNLTNSLNGYNGWANPKNKYAGKVLNYYNNFKQKMEKMN